MTMSSFSNLSRPNTLLYFQSEKQQELPNKNYDYDLLTDKICKFLGGRIYHFYLLMYGHISEILSKNFFYQNSLLSVV